MTVEQFIEKLKEYAPEFEFKRFGTTMTVDVHRDDVGFGLDLSTNNLSDTTAKEYSEKMYQAWENMQAKWEKMQ